MTSPSPFHLGPRSSLRCGLDTFKRRNSAERISEPTAERYGVPPPVSGDVRSNNNMRFKCPSCNEATISAWQKLLATPCIKQECSECGAKVYKSGFRWAIMAILYNILIVPVAILAVLGAMHTLWFLVIALWIVLDQITLKVVPLMFKQEPNK